RKLPRRPRPPPGPRRSPPSPGTGGGAAACPAGGRRRGSEASGRSEASTCPRPPPRVAGVVLVGVVGAVARVVRGRVRRGVGPGDRHARAAGQGRRRPVQVGEVGRLLLLLDVMVPLLPLVVTVLLRFSGVPAAVSGTARDLLPHDAVLVRVVALGDAADEHGPPTARERAGERAAGAGEYLLDLGR
ncbi:hypothetical protein THAOC_09105, partial [Thalassiosira oceanica]